MCFHNILRGVEDVTNPSDITVGAMRHLLLVELCRNVMLFTTHAFMFSSGERTHAFDIFLYFTINNISQTIRSFYPQRVIGDKV